MSDVYLFAALLAGLVSFLSPCVLPLVPGYASMISGIGTDQRLKGEQARSGLLAASLSFVAGFSAVFITFGASASAVGQFLRQNRAVLAPAAGALILLFGLHFLGWLAEMSLRVGIAIGAAFVAIGLFSALQGGRIIGGFRPIHFISLSMIGFLGPLVPRWLNRDVHLRSQNSQPGVWSGFLLGFAFAFGWTPCIGPILATVLALAAATDTVAGEACCCSRPIRQAWPFLFCSRLWGSGSSCGSTNAS